jgi:membrane-bound ClpP family serine protease
MMRMASLTESHPVATTLATLGAAGEPAIAAGLDGTMLGYALALLALAAVLLVMELFVVSFGILAVAALVAAAGAIYFAFLAGDVAGYTITLATPLLAVVIVRWGLRRIQASTIVPKTEITAEAGYHHVADRLGVKAGSVGVMVTPARPSGRARFEGGECDVQAQSGALERDAAVVVKRIDGPIIFVAPRELGQGE